MKRNTTLFTPLVLLALTCLNFSCSTPKDGSVGISIDEKGLSAGKVYVTDGVQEIDVRRFVYGEKIYTNFSDLEGFTIEDGKFYPEMYMYVLSKSGDTIMNYENMFANANEGFDAQIPTINGHVILARPIYSREKYVVHYAVKDARGDASMTTKMDFELIPDPKVKVKPKGLDYSEAYIYSEDKQEVIQDGTFKFYENLRFDFQDLDGYVLKDGAVHLGMSVKVIDDRGNTILDEADVFKTPIYDEVLLKQGVSATLTVNEGQVSNPLKWRVRIWDKNSDASLNAETTINVE